RWANLDPLIAAKKYSTLNVMTHLFIFTIPSRKGDRGAKHTCSMSVSKSVSLKAHLHRGL
ncbi:MAG: hypothetical protein VX007_10220, partial [Pseudomonadota bacterium]|nr:hypothetical protein [Pseudomonadota bacterium]